MSEKNNKKELNFFELLKDLNDQDKALENSGVAITEETAKLTLSNVVISARSHPGGGIVSMGVTGRTLLDILSPSPTGASSKICILCIIDKGAYDTYKKENGFK